jgi:hypothetical protein
LNPFVSDIQKPETLCYVLGMKKELLIPHIKENNLYRGGDYSEWIKYNLLDLQVISLINQNRDTIQEGIKV